VQKQDDNFPPHVMFKGKQISLLTEIYTVRPHKDRVRDTKWPDDEDVQSVTLHPSEFYSVLPTRLCIR
jgi:hypothetical protein